MELAFDEYGKKGKPLILIHGLFGSSDNWRTLSRRFSEQFHVFGVDLRNHGRSPHSGEMSYEVMADDLLEFIRGHQLSPANVLGHSLGGKVAMQLALHYPAEVDKLIVADIAPGEYPPSHRPILEALAELDLTEIGSRGDADEALSKKIPGRTVRQFLLKNLSRREDGSYAWQMNLDSLRENYDALIKAITVQRQSSFPRPTLFIRGGNSDYITPARDETRIQELFPKAEILTIPNAGHWVHAEAPDAVFEAVTEFVSG